MNLFDELQKTPGLLNRFQLLCTEEGDAPEVALSPRELVLYQLFLKQLVSSDNKPD